MELGAVKSINFKGKNSSEIQLEEQIAKFKQTEKLLQESEDEFKKEDMKGPLAIGTAVVYATGKTAAKGALAALAVDKFTNLRTSEAFENLLKTGSKLTKTAAKTLKENNGKLKRVANFTGKVLAKSEDIAHRAYKTISKSNKTRGFAIVSAIVSALTFVPMICLRDDNKDGIKDIAQKSENVYKSRSKKLDKLTEDIGFISKLTETLT